MLVSSVVFLLLLSKINNVYGYRFVDQLVAESVTLLPAHLENTTAVIRIVGGSRVTEIEEAPWIASLQRNNKHVCGASVVSQSAVITAAHCLLYIRTKSQLSIRMGSVHLYKGGMHLKVTKYMQHPNYNFLNSSNDIAIVYFNLPSDITSMTLATVKLPVDLSNLTIGTVTSVFGWGATGENFPAVFQLRSVDVPIVSTEDCSRSYENRIGASMICAGYLEGNKDACQGDSGGPLMADGNTLVGIVSFGEGCARPAKYGVYTKVALFTNWIKQLI